MFPRRNPYAPKPFPWLKTALCLLLCGAAWVAYRYWLAPPNAASSRSANAPGKRVSPQNAPPGNSSAKPREEPLTQLAILVFKSEKRMEVWGMRACQSPPPTADGLISCFCYQWSQLREYPILAASGSAGPKLLQGDRQVPEGIYHIVELNPRSRFHRSLKLDYPNAFDRKQASKDGRTTLGSDICIHGKNASIGCVAIGDAAIEDLYALVEQIKPANVKVIIAPNDLREHVPVKNPTLKVEWLRELYGEIQRELCTFGKH